MICRFIAIQCLIAAAVALIAARALWPPERDKALDKDAERPDSDSYSATQDIPVDIPAVEEAEEVRHQYWSKR